MKTTFVIDLLRPGQIAHGRYEWFVGPGAPRRLLKVFAVGVTVLALVLAGGLAPRYWRHSADLRRIAQLEQEIATTTADMAALRGQLASMSAEARRQVRWTELLATLSREAPAALKLHRVSLRRAGAYPRAILVGTGPGGLCRRAEWDTGRTWVGEGRDRLTRRGHPGHSVKAWPRGRVS